LRRRQFITLLGGAAAWPLAAHAQASRLPVIGFLGSATASAWVPWTAAFVNRLRALGWIEDRTVKIEYRWADGREERYDEIAAEFVKLNVAVIVISGAAGLAAKRATSTTPIVFALAQDPVAAGLVASLSRPGGNVTGLSSQETDIAGKRLEILSEMIPNLRHLAVMVNAGNPNPMLEKPEVERAAHVLGIEVSILEVRRAEDIAVSLEAVSGRADALLVLTDALTNINRVRINTLALAIRLPTMHGNRESVEAGGLIYYGSNIPDLFRRAAELVDKILRGAKPADIPVEQPTKFDLVVNLTTAKALGLTVPLALLTRADEVIE
jgi:putative ABC transport system substrate-binding protein